MSAARLLIRGLIRPLLLLSGLDSLYVSFYLDTGSCQIDWEELAYQKIKARNERKALAEIALGSERFALMPYGKYPYGLILVNKAFEVRLAERMQPSAHVQFYSEALWTEGLNALMQRFLAWCASVGLVRLRPEIVSRADWAFDYHIPTVDFTPESFVSRATKDATHRENGKVQTFRMGQGDIVVRVYDKVAEIDQQSGKTFFYDLWDRKDEVWRIEFQVRGERLKEAGIRTIADLKTLQNDLLRELATNHTTLRRETADRNRSRWPLHPLWQVLQADIAALPQTGLIRSIDPQAELQWRQRKQLQSLYGSLKGIAAVSGLREKRQEPVTLEELFRILPTLLDEYHSASMWNGDVAQRMTAYRLGQW